jgi:hypothetical protein
MKKTPEQLKAELRWTVACEKLGFVLAPPTGALPDNEAMDLVAAVHQARAALDELQVAFSSVDAWPTGPTGPTLSGPPPR